MGAKSRPFSQVKCKRRATDSEMIDFFPEIENFTRLSQADITYIEEFILENDRMQG
jgi:hypothetical protein